MNDSRKPEEQNEPPMMPVRPPTLQELLALGLDELRANGVEVDRHLETGERVATGVGRLLGLFRK